MKAFWVFLMVWGLGSFVLPAQIVETVVSHPKIVDGIYVDEAGNVYTTAGGLQNGNEIGIVDASETYRRYAGGFAGTIAIARDTTGIFYVTNYDDNTVKAYDPDSGTVTTIASNLNGPAGITLDNQGYLYVTSWGAPPNYNGRAIFKISPNGTVSTLYSGTPLFRPQGIAFANDGNLYLSNSSDGKLFRLDTATASLTEIASMGVKLGNMAFQDGFLYIASQEVHKIYKVDLNGNATVFAGTGNLGGQDGAALAATFNKPLGVAFTRSGDTLYIAEAGGRRLRRVVMKATAVTDQFDQESKAIMIYPNPAQGSANLYIPVDGNQKASVRLYSPEGKKVGEWKIRHQQKLHKLGDSLAPGTWIIEVETKSGIHKEKLVIH